MGVAALRHEQPCLERVVLPLQPKVLDRDAVDSAQPVVFSDSRCVGHAACPRWRSSWREACLELWAKERLQLAWRGWFCVPARPVVRGRKAWMGRARGAARAGGLGQAAADVVVRVLAGRLAAAAAYALQAASPEALAWPSGFPPVTARH